jgi:hypothetical protein
VEVEGLRLLVLILRDAPAAFVRGRLVVDRYNAVYGLPARLMGVLLIQLVVLAVGDAIYWEFVVGHWDWPDWYLLFRLGTVAAGILGPLLLYLVFRERRSEISSGNQAQAEATGHPNREEK